MRDWGAEVGGGSYLEVPQTKGGRLHGTSALPLSPPSPAASRG